MRITVPEMVGRRYGRLTVLAVESRGTGAKIAVLCDCGTNKSVRASHVQGGLTKSCGCYMRQMTKEKNTTHGQCRTKEYDAWCGMKRRCYKEIDKNYKNYGGRGITVCERWRHSFEAFLEDMGPRPAKHSIERVDVNGNYEPSNCRWATHKEQMHNTRLTTLSVEIAKEIRRRVATGESKASVARSLGVNYSSVKQVAYGHQW